MGKFLKITIITIIVFFLILAAVGFVLVKTFDIEAFKPRIIAAAEKSLGRSVQCDAVALDFSWQKGLSLDLVDVAVGEDPDFGSDNFFSAKTIAFSVSLKDFFLKRQIRVLAVEVKSLALVVTRLNDGRLNVQSFDFLSMDDLTADRDLEGSLVNKKKPLPAGALPAIFINRLVVENSQIVYNDHSFDSPLRLVLNDLDFAATDVTLSDYFPVKMEAAFASSQRNITLNGQARIDIEKNSFLLADTLIEAELSALSEQLLGQSLPQLEGLSNFEIDSGTMRVYLKLFEAGPQGLTVLRLDADLENAAISFEEITSGMPLALRHVQANLKDFSLEDIFGFNFRAAYFSQEPNISIKGNARVDLDQEEFRAQGITAVVDLSRFLLDDWQKKFGHLEGVSMLEDLKGLVNIDIEKLEAGSAKPLAFTVRARLSEGLVKLQPLLMPLGSLQAVIVASESKVALEKAELTIGQGKISLEGLLEDYLHSQKFSLRALINDFNIAEAIEQTSSEIKVKGLASGDIALSGRSFSPEAMLSGLKGGGSFNFREGELTDINILKMVLDKFVFLPNLSRLLEENLPQGFKEKISKKDTIVTDCKVIFEIYDKLIDIKSLSMTADSFEFKGEGRADFEQKYNLDGIFVIPRELASNMLKASQQLQFLADSSGRMLFPLKIFGQGPSVAFMPDIQAIGSTAIQTKAREGLEKILDKFLDKGSDGVPQEGKEDISEKKPERRETIDDLLDSIFKR